MKGLFAAKRLMVKAVSLFSMVITILASLKMVKSKAKE
jgi:hypothetical protein